MRRPPAGAKRRRKRANELTTMLAAVTPRSKPAANWGRIGAMIP
jgi:hypothetical protein